MAFIKISSNFVRFNALFWTFLLRIISYEIMKHDIICISDESSCFMGRIGENGSKNRKSPFSPFLTDFSGKTVMNEILGLRLLNMMSGSKIPILQLFVYYHFHSIVPAKLSVQLLPKPNS